MKKVLFLFLSLLIISGYTYSQNAPTAINFAGDYYIGAVGTGPGGSNPQFATLKAACDSLNNGSFTGNVTMWITSNLDEATNSGLAVNPAPYTLTFKPYAAKTPVITFLNSVDANSGPSGAWIIGIPATNNIAWNDLKITKNIVIDGSNTVGGTTRDLTIQNATTAHRNTIPIVIVGDVSNMTVKNCKIYYKHQSVSTSGSLFAGAVQIRSRNNASVDWVPANITFQNCHLSTNFDGVPQNVNAITTYQTGTPVPVTYPSGIVISNSLIEGTRRAIGLYKAGSMDIFGNEIIVNQSIAATTISDAIYAADVLAGSVINIYNNKFSKISTINNVAANGASAINIETNGTYNIYNNMIFGFESKAAAGSTAPACNFFGIRNASATATANIIYNSIYMPDLGVSFTAGGLNYSGIVISNGINTLKNNIVYSAEAADSSFAIYRGVTTGSLNSDYNCLYAPGTNSFIGCFGTTLAKTLENWKTASQKDTNSISYNPLFASATDLHLSSSATPPMGKGTPISWITKDYDGTSRDNPPEIGADELTGLLPVELTSFSASFVNNSVILKWNTATEINNSDFTVEKRIDNSVWSTIATVKGNGTSSDKHEYSVVDTKITSGKMYYRLRQNDFDGSFVYSKVIEIAANAVPSEFTLSQNYPNPFNPATVIKFSVPVDSKVRVDVYSVTGQLVSTLFNGYKSAGNYEVTFKADNLASGIYIYKLSAGSVSITKKMQLLK